MATATSDPFANVPPRRYLPFYDERGALDTQKVAAYLHDKLKYKNEDLAKIAGVSLSSVRFEPHRVPQKVKERFQEIANIFELVAEHFAGDVEKTTLWFCLKNPLLGNVAPRDMIRFGRFARLLQILMDFRNGHQA